MKTPNWLYQIKRKFTKEHLHLMKVAWKGYAFDSGSLLELEKAKLQELGKYFKDHSIVVGDELWVRDINICIGLLNIMTEETELIDYDKYFGRPADDSNFMVSLEHATEMRKNNDFSFLTKHVNTKNIKYWCPDATESEIKTYLKFPEEFYRIKAEKLYYKIRQAKTGSWWN